MSQISSDALASEIANDLNLRLQNFSKKWSPSIKADQLVLMISTLKTSANNQIACEVNAALTAHKANKSLAEYKKKFDLFKSPAFLNRLVIGGGTLEKGRLQGEPRQDGLQILKDFSVFVGEKASAYFAELAPYQPDIEITPVVKAVKPVSVVSPLHKTTKLSLDLAKLHQSSLKKLESFKQNDVDRIYRGIQSENPIFLKSHYRQSILPLYLALSWDIRQKKSRGEAISERDMKLKQLLENAYGVCKEKIDLLEERKASSVVELKTKQPHHTQEVIGAGLRQAKEWSVRRMVAVGMFAASGIAGLLISSAGFFQSAAAEKTNNESVSKSPAASMTFNKHTEVVAVPAVKIEQTTLPSTEMVLPIKPHHKIKATFKTSSNDNIQPATINGFQLQRTTQETVTNLCGVYTHPTWLCNTNG